MHSDEDEFAFGSPSTEESQKFDETVEDKEPTMSDDQIDNYKDALAMKKARSKASKEDRIKEIKRDVKHRLQHGEHVSITKEMRDLGLELVIMELIMSAGVANRFNKIVNGDEDDA